MIDVFKLSKNNIVTASVSDMQSSHFVWINVVSPTDDDLNNISGATGLPVDDLMDIIKKDVRPSVYDGEEYSSIYFDTPSNSESVTVPLGIFLLKNNNLLTISREPVDALEKIEDIANKNKINLLQTQGSFTNTLLDAATSSFFKVFDAVEDSVDDTEKEAFASPSKQTAKNIFINKKKLFTLHKSLLANREVISAIEKEYITRISKKDTRKFRGVYDDIVTLIDVEETLRDISTGILDVYLSSVSNSINTTMKKMTAWASLILVPTLIASIYGMNFKFMPELDWQFGYLFSLGLMGLSMLVLYSMFKIKKYF